MPELNHPQNAAAVIIFLPQAEIMPLSNGYRIRVAQEYEYGSTRFEACLKWVARYGQKPSEGRR